MSDDDGTDADVFISEDDLIYIEDVASELLSDGSIRTHDELLAVMKPRIPVGQAVRAARAVRTGRSHDSVNIELAAGARLIATRCIARAVRNGTWVQEGDRYRMNTSERGAAMSDDDGTDADVVHLHPVPSGTEHEENTDDEPKKEKKSQSTVLVELAQSDYMLGVAESGEVFAVAHSGPNVALKLRGGRHSLRAALASAFHRATGRAPTASALSDALSVLEGMAHQSDPVELPLRVARDHRGRIVVDLGGPDGCAVVVRPGSWEVVERSPVLFARSDLTVPMPCPSERNEPGALDRLRDLLNVDDEQFHLLAAWLVAAIVPEIPHPVLAILGVAGTGKSTAGRIIGMTVDPTAAPLRSGPRNEDSWSVAAAGSWAVVLDNLSDIKPWFSDALCRAVTGDGRVVRRLYSDSDVSVLRFRRCIVMTSIDTGALRGDLAQRLVPVELQRIDPTRRRTEADVVDRFTEDHPVIIGGLLDLLAQVLEVLPSIELDELPRLADFARVCAAVDRVTGWSTLHTFLGVGDSLAMDVIESDPVAGAVLELLECDGGEWHGTSGELLEAISGADDERHPKDWPASPRALSGDLLRAEGALRSVGANVRRGTGRHRRTWYLESEESREPPSPPSPPARANGHKASTGDGPTLQPSPGDGPTVTPPGTVTAEPLPIQAGDGRDGRDGPERIISSAGTCPGCGGPPGSFSNLCADCASDASRPFTEETP